MLTVCCASTGGFRFSVAELLSATGAGCFCLAFAPLTPMVFVLTLIIATCLTLPVGFWLLIDSIGGEEWHDASTERVDNKGLHTEHSFGRV